MSINNLILFPIFIFFLPWLGYKHMCRVRYVNRQQRRFFGRCRDDTVVSCNRVNKYTQRIIGKIFVCQWAEGTDDDDNNNDDRESGGVTLTYVKKCVRVRACARGERDAFLFKGTGSIKSRSKYNLDHFKSFHIKSLLFSFQRKKL